MCLTLFQTSRTAARALYDESSFMPYKNGLSHLNALFNFVNHMARAIWDLMKLIYRLITLPLRILNPFAWIGIPGHLLKTLDNAIGTTTDLITIAAAPVVFIMRTMTSLLFGYTEDTGIELNENQTQSFA